MLVTTLSVVIPAYNEEGGIADIVHRVLAVRDDLIKSGVNNLGHFTVCFAIYFFSYD